MQFRWKASFSATCLHAAASIHEGLPIADHELASTLLDEVENLDRELKACSLSAEQAFPLLISLAAEYENNRELVEVAVTRLLGKSSLNDVLVSKLAGSVASLENALLQKTPQLVEELAVRGRPLREQWEARALA